MIGAPEPVLSALVWLIHCRQQTAAERAKRAEFQQDMAAAARMHSILDSRSN